MAKCKICGAEVSNPDHPKHIASKKHQDAIIDAELYELEIDDFDFDEDLFEDNFSESDADRREMDETFSGEMNELSYEHIREPTGKIVKLDEAGIHTIHIMDNDEEVPVLYKFDTICIECEEYRLCCGETAACPVCDGLMDVEEYDQIIKLREEGIGLGPVEGDRVSKEHIRALTGRTPKASDESTIFFAYFGLIHVFVNSAMIFAAIPVPCFAFT